jgi:hypothetical protein
MDVEDELCAILTQEVERGQGGGGGSNQSDEGGRRKYRQRGRELELGREIDLWRNINSSTAHGP